MLLLAFILDDTHYPPERWTLLPLCVFLPLFVILVSWLLVRRARKFVAFALIIAGLAAWQIISRMNEELRRFELYRSTHPTAAVSENTPEEIASPWVAALFPFVMIALFYFTARTPNQSPQRNALDHL